MDNSTNTGQTTPTTFHVQSPGGPTADFTWSSGPQNKVTFTDTSTITSGCPANHVWRMGDSANTVVTNPNNPFTFQYASSGSKFVHLTITQTGTCGGSDVTAKMVTAVASPGFHVGPISPAGNVAPNTYKTYNADVTVNSGSNDVVSCELWIDGSSAGANGNMNNADAGGIPFYNASGHCTAGNTCTATVSYMFPASAAGTHHVFAKCASSSGEVEQGSPVIITVGTITPGPTGGLVPACGGPGQPPCTLCDLFILVNNILNFITGVLAPIVAVLLIAWGSLIMLTSTGNPGRISSGKDIVTKVIIGLVIIYLSWAVINLAFQFFHISTFNGIGGWWSITCTP